MRLEALEDGAGFFLHGFTTLPFMVKLSGALVLNTASGARFTMSPFEEVDGPCWAWRPLVRHETPLGTGSAEP